MWKPWIIKGGINSQTKYQTVEKKRKFIEILTLYNYTVVDECCIKETNSRFINSNYRKDIEKEDINLGRKSNSNSMKKSDNKYPIQSQSDLEKGVTTQSKANSN